MLRVVSWEWVECLGPLDVTLAPELTRLLHSLGQAEHRDRRARGPRAPRAEHPRVRVVRHAMTCLGPHTGLI